MTTPVVVTDQTLPGRSLTVNTDGSLNVTSAPPTGSSSTTVQGTAAESAAPVGNPVQLGAQDYNTSVMRALKADGSGHLSVALGATTAAADGAGNNIARPFSEGNTSSGLWVAPYLFNGSTWDRVRSVPASDDQAVTGIVAAGGMVFDGVNWDRIRGGVNADAIATTGLVSQQTFLYNGATWDRMRSASSSDVAATGIAASGIYGKYSTNANQPVVTNGNLNPVHVDPAGNLRTAPQRPTASDIIAGTLAHTSTNAAATIVTVAAGRTWVGVVSISCDVGIAAASPTAGQALGVVTTAGTGVVPAAGTYLACEARAGANAATGTVGAQGANSNSIPMTVVAPAGNAVTIQGTTTIAGTAGRVDYAAFGVMQ